MTARRVWTVMAVAGVVCSLVGCSGAERTAVPDTAHSPWLCSGVPQRSVELALGVTELADDSGQGVEPWGRSGFRCRGVTPDAVVIVRQRSFESSGRGTDEASILAQLQEDPRSHRVQADAPGGGYVLVDDDVQAVWVCAGLVTTVQLLGDEPKGRDWGADASNLLVSMLPWACDEQEPPVDDPSA